MPPQPEPQRSEEWRAKQGASIKASWTPERKARQAEMMRARRAAMLADPNRKPSKAQLARRKKAEREAAKARAAERKEILQASILEQGRIIKTPEQRQQSKQEYLASKATRTRDPEYHFAPWPQTLDALRSGCGQYGDLILSHAVATAARSWACDAIDEDGTTPAIRETLATILELIQNSDEPTLAQYDQALNEFNQTGDNSALEALGPLIVDDFKALIVAKGLATADDVAGYDWDITDALAFDTGAVAAEPWDPTPAEFNAPAATAEGTQEGNNMTALNAKQYADAVRELRANSNGQPIENTPEYAALQGRLLGNAPVASGPAPTTRNGDAYIPGQFTATGYRAPMTGDRARSYAGTPIWNGNPE